MMKTGLLLGMLLDLLLDHRLALEVRRVHLDQPGHAHQSRRHDAALGCRLSLTVFAFRFALGFLLILGSLIGMICASAALTFRLSIGPTFRGWLRTAGSRRLLSARTGTSLEVT